MGLTWRLEPGCKNPQMSLPLTSVQGNAGKEQKLVQNEEELTKLASGVINLSSCPYLGKCRVLRTHYNAEGCQKLCDY